MTSAITNTDSGTSPITPHRLANRMGRLGTETALEVLVRAQALAAMGRDIIHLEIGEPDFDTPENIVDAGTDALRRGGLITDHRQVCLSCAKRLRGM
jgi:hypothetical protein